MRITDSEQLIIKQTINDLDQAALIYLFGSRAHDSAQGGDIDLLVISQHLRLMDKLSILEKLHRLLGDQKIDMSIYTDLSTPFARIAQHTGQQL